MKSNSKYYSDREKKISEIANVFGKPDENDKKIKEGETIVYKEKTYTIEKTNIPFPDNRNELTEIIKLLNLDNLTKEPTEEINYSHSDIDASPYPDCSNFLEDLLTETKSKLENFITELEDDHKEPNRLIKPNYLGFYKPYHFYPESWGIYMNIQLLQAQGSRIYNYNNLNNIVAGLTQTEAGILSFLQTYFHEMFHHKFELLGTKLELAIRKPVYTNSFHKFYCETLYTDYCLEEAFANVFGLNKSLEYIVDKQIMSHSKRDLKRLLRKSIIRDSLPGYRVAYEITGLNNMDAERYYENTFLEIILDFTHRVFNNNVPPIAVESLAWDMFTYRLDPLVNTDNTITFII